MGRANGPWAKGAGLRASTEPILSDWSSLPTALLRQGVVEESDWAKPGRTSLSLSYTGMLKVSWTRRLNWSTSYMRKASTFAASRRETHLKSNKKVMGYQCCRSDRTDRSKGGVLTLVRHNINACLIDTHVVDSEYQVLDIKADAAHIQLVNFYCPNNKPLSLDTISTEVSNFIIVGDFNSHSRTRGYQHMDRRGEEVENWQDENRLLSINSPSDQPTFYSRQWQTTSTPDIGPCTEDLHGSIRREVGEQLGGSDHRPMFLKLNLGAST